MKYPRTFHLTFSPGATNDDKIMDSNLFLINKPILITEKLDGSNFCISHNGCFARSHHGPPTHKSYDLAKSFFSSIKNKIPESFFIYMEYCYAQHSLFYNKLASYFNIFNIFDDKNKTWLSWDEVELWTKDVELQTVPILFKGSVISEKKLKELIESLMIQPSTYGDIKEGVVVRIQDSFSNNIFSNCVSKFVRKNHVNDDTHWLHKKIIKNILR